MKTYRKVRRTTDSVDKVICNKCGKEFASESLALGFIESFDIEFGYGAGALDGKKWQFDLCISCIESMADSFDINVTENDYIYF